MRAFNRAMATGQHAEACAKLADYDAHGFGDGADREAMVKQVQRLRDAGPACKR